MTSSTVKDKPFKIDKRDVYKAVKSNQGAAGVDGQTLKQFEADWKRNLYRGNQGPVRLLTKLQRRRVPIQPPDIGASFNQRGTDRTYSWCSEVYK